MRPARAPTSSASASTSASTAGRTGATWPVMTPEPRPEAPTPSCCHAPCRWPAMRSAAAGSTSAARWAAAASKRRGAVPISWSGVDLNFSMLRVAERARRSARAVFPLRRVGIVHDRFDQHAPDLPSDRVGFWCCDVGVLPFGDACFDGALMLNLIDCVPSPLALLCEAGRVLADGAPALFSSPYDWSAQATPPAQWLGGHSQRGPGARRERARAATHPVARARRRHRYRAGDRVRAGRRAVAAAHQRAFDRCSTRCTWRCCGKRCTAQPAGR